MVLLLFGDFPNDLLRVDERIKWPSSGHALESDQSERPEVNFVRVKVVLTLLTRPELGRLKLNFIN